MFMKSAISKSVILSGIAAMTLSSLAGGAQAYDGRGPHREFRGHAPAYSHRAPAPQPRFHGERDRRHDGDKALKRGLAIGLGAAIIGGIIAAEANRSRVHEYYE